MTFSSALGMVMSPRELLWTILRGNVAEKGGREDSDGEEGLRVAFSSAQWRENEGVFL